MEKLVKNMLGQWNIIQAPLIKTEDIKQSEPNNNIDHHKVAMDHMDNIKALSMLGKHDMAKEHGKKLQQHMFDSPHGSLDFGTLEEARKAMPEKAKYNSGFSQENMRDILHHHIKDAKDLKEVHDKHGGMGTIGALVHANGANGEPVEYASSSLPKQLHNELLAVTYPNKASSYDDAHPIHATEYSDKHKSNVDTTFDNSHADSNNYDESGSPHGTNHQHEKAVAERAKDMVKDYYKI